ncbi:Syntaxin-61 [Glycine soja]
MADNASKPSSLSIAQLSLYSHGSHRLLIFPRSLEMELNGYKVSVSTIQSLFPALPSFKLRNALKAFFYLAVVISQFDCGILTLERFLILARLQLSDYNKVMIFTSFFCYTWFLLSCSASSVPKAGLLEANGKAEERGHAVTDLCTVLDGLLVVVAIQSLQGIVLLSCSVSAQTLSVAKKKKMGETKDWQVALTQIKAGNTVLKSFGKIINLWRQDEELDELSLSVEIIEKKVAMVMKKASANGQIRMILGLLALFIFLFIFVFFT